GERMKVRIATIDAPEICQAWGAQARAALQEKLAGQVLSLERLTHDSYGRELIVLSIYFIARILHRRRPAGVNLAWIILVLLLPYVGIIAYMLLGEHTLSRARLVRAAQMEDSRRHWLAQIPTTSYQASSCAVEQTWRSLALQAHAQLGIPPTDAKNLRLLTDTVATWELLAQDIHAAQHSVWFTFYIWQAGGAVDTVAQALMAAAERGVSCHVLLDAMGSKAFWHSPWPQKLRTAGVQVESAFATGLIRSFFQRIDLRMHRKSVVIDGQIAYTGSMNLIDPRTFKQGSGVGEWVDAMLRYEGVAVLAQLGLNVWDWNMEATTSSAMVDLPQLPPYIQQLLSGAAAAAQQDTSP
ncbi:unnamed protein product, partial [Darwinula stevensoni]